MRISDYHLFVLPLLRTLLFFTFESNGKCDDDQKVRLGIQMDFCVSIVNCKYTWFGSESNGSCVIHLVWF